jgi:thioesterase domain-containing protein/acyl carrier protein
LQALVGFVECEGDTPEGAMPSSITLNDRFGSSIECRIERVAKLPLTESGTVDITRLLSDTSQERRVRKDPETPTEIALVKIWRDLLQVTDIGTEDNFFELGGDSLLAVQLVAAIGKAFGTKVPASAVFHAPTIAKLAAQLGGEPRTSDWFSLVPIRTAGSKPALFVVQSVSWNLVRHLDPDQPVYVLNYGVGAKSTKDMLKLPNSLLELAVQYVKEMLAVQSSGPYFIIGHSGAGLIAYEIAQQLTKLGHRVGLLGLVDTFDSREQRRRSALARKMKLMMLVDMPLKDSAILIHRRIWGRLQAIAFKIFGDKSQVELATRSQHLCDAYIPESYQGHAVYWKCTRQSRLEPPSYDEEKWGALVNGGIEVHAVPCRHYEIMREPHVSAVAEVINRYCADA